MKINIQLTPSHSKSIFVYEGDSPRRLASEFSCQNSLPEQTQLVLEEQIHHHLAMLARMQT
jgi:hypothetical protein